jgi:hypothetical protein
VGRGPPGPPSRSTPAAGHRRAAQRTRATGASGKRPPCRTSGAEHGSARQSKSTRAAPSRVTTHLLLSPLLPLSLLSVICFSVGCSSVPPTLIPVLGNVYFTLVSLEAQDQIKFLSFQFCFRSCSFLFHGVFTFRLVCFPLPSSFLSSCLQMVVPSDLICFFV